MRARLQGAGYDVVLADDHTVTAAGRRRDDVRDHHELGERGRARPALTGVATPLWGAKPYLMDNYGLAGPTGEVDYGSRAARTIDVVAPDHRRGCR